MFAYFVYTLTAGPRGFFPRNPREPKNTSMSIFFIKLADRSSNVHLQSVLGTYGHLMWVRSEVPGEMIVKIVSTPELAGEAEEVLRALRDEIEFEFVDAPAGGEGAQR